MTASSTDRIDKEIYLNASIDRVWEALTDYKQFSQWFGVTLESSFEPGQVSKGILTHACSDHANGLEIAFAVQKIQPKHYFSYQWHPYAVDLSVDYDKEAMTLVEFKLEAEGDGTLLKVTESGFDQLPAHRRDEALRMNTGGWEHQLGNICDYVSKNA